MDYSSDFSNGLLGRPVSKKAISDSTQTSAVACAFSLLLAVCLEFQRMGRSNLQY